MSHQKETKNINISQILKYLTTTCMQINLTLCILTVNTSSILISDNVHIHLFVYLNQTKESLKIPYFLSKSSSNYNQCKSKTFLNVIIQTLYITSHILLIMIPTDEGNC